MKILITGGLGYLGGRLASFFKSNGHHVTISSRKSYQEISRDSLKLFDEIIQIKSRNGEWKNDLSFAQFDAVFHLAALNENDCVKFPFKAIEVNVGDTLRIINQCINDKVEKFIYLSTFHVYGSGINAGISENDICRPTHPYSITHKSAEDYVLAARINSSMNASCIRLSNVYGYPANAEANRWTLLVNDLCKQAIQTQKMILKSSGLQRRDFLTMEDFCTASELILNSSKEQLYDGIINVGSGLSSTVLDMANSIQQLCADHFNFKPALILGEGGERNEQMRFNIKRLNSLGFQLKNDARKEILGTLEYFRNDSHS